MPDPRDHDGAIWAITMGGIRTQSGVLKASRTATGLATTAVTSLCGKPVRVTSVNDTTWAVATTLSFVVLAESGAGLKVTSTTRLVPGPNRTWSAVQVPAGPLATALCRTLDSALGTVGATLAAQSTALARVDSSRVLLAGGPLLFELANLGAPAPSIPRSAWTGDLIRALRVDDDRGRAYAVGVLGDDDVFDLKRAGLPSLGHHDARTWVEQRSSSPLGVRVTGGRAQVAKVIP